MHFQRPNILTPLYLITAHKHYKTLQPETLKIELNDSKIEASNFMIGQKYGESGGSYKAIQSKPGMSLKYLGSLRQ